MNLEDFKSFRRVLRPPEVGSIPTHSRQLVRRPRSGVIWLCGFAIVCAFAARAAAAPEASRAQSEAASGARVPSPANRAARSAAFPAWGQLTNERPAKAAALFALETYLATSIVIQTRRGNADRRAADAAEDSREAMVADGLADAHFDRRRNLIFWSLLTMLYGIVDAYVDGYLGDFDAEVEEGRTLFSNVDPVDRSVEVGVRF